ncbi:efflux RND transporter periplasmic adaptor subunit [uncultured Oxalicibacterium sp.]|uniref:efflux RND transporter periplasmic adaptor subunit n=1 Tax=uncultured Oxalicibacterium sp. TaxID=1168540 RepID=UPI0025CBEBF7|nr:efflux RND transporter periplasmic adaptor subunit [uncultured Oxalicibacterium sp.]
MFYPNKAAGSLLVACCLTAGLTACSKPDPVKPSPAAPVHSQVPGQLKIQPASMKMLDIQTVKDMQDTQTAWAPAHIAFRDDQVTAVNAQVSARVVEIHANVGDVVKQGSPLVTLASPEAVRIRYELSKAEVGYQVALTETKRQQAMYEKNVGTQVDKLAAEARLREAEQEMERARRTVGLMGQGKNDRIVISAPRTGVIASRNATIGATVEPTGDPLFVIGDPKAVWVVAEVFENDLTGMRVGAPAQIELSSMSSLVSGKIQRIGAVLSAETRRAPVFVTLDSDKPLPELRPGMLARVGLQVPSQPGMVIPLSAVLIKDERRSIVYVQTGENTFEARDVTLGAPSRGNIAVISGLKPGDRVVVRGGLLLDGAASQLL